jgi:ABC-type multidrug transport system fused ATPase/permease subunit
LRPDIGDQAHRSNARQALVVALWAVPKLGGALLPFIAFTLAAFTVVGLMIRKYETRAAMSKDVSSTSLEQCLSGIRVVQTFSMSDSLIKRWASQMVTDTEATGVKETMIDNINGAILRFSATCVLLVGYLYGQKLVRGGISYGFVITVSSPRS